MIFKRNKIITFLFSTMILLNSCVSLYTSTPPNTPLFEKKNEFQTEASLQPANLNLKSSYSITNHIGAQMNGNIAKGVLYDDRRYHYYIEGALGLYHNFQHLIIEGYVGYGIGKSQYEYNPLSSVFSPFKESVFVHSEGYYNKQFLQLDFAYKYKNQKIGVCVRIANINYTYSYFDEKAYPNYNNIEIGKLYKNRSYEPYIFYIFDITNSLSLINHFGFTLIPGNNIIFIKNQTINKNIINLGGSIRINFDFSKKNNKIEYIIN